MAMHRRCRNLELERLVTGPRFRACCRRAVPPAPHMEGVSPNRLQHQSLNRRPGSPGDPCKPAGAVSRISGSANPVPPLAIDFPGRYARAMFLKGNIRALPAIAREGCQQGAALLSDGCGNLFRFEAEPLARRGAEALPRGARHLQVLRPCDRARQRLGRALPRRGPRARRRQRSRQVHPRLHSLGGRPARRGHGLGGRQPRAHRQPTPGAGARHRRGVPGPGPRRPARRRRQSLSRTGADALSHHRRPPADDPRVHRGHRPTRRQPALGAGPGRGALGRAAPGRRGGARAARIGARYAHGRTDRSTRGTRGGAGQPSDLEAPRGRTGGPAGEPQPRQRVRAGPSRGGAASRPRRRRRDRRAHHRRPNVGYLSNWFTHHWTWDWPFWFEVDKEYDGVDYLLFAGVPVDPAKAFFVTFYHHVSSVRQKSWISGYPWRRAARLHPARRARIGASRAGDHRHPRRRLRSKRSRSTASPRRRSGSR